MTELKKRRVMNEYTQVELAGMLQISQSHLSNLERGLIEPDKKLEKKIDKVFSSDNDE